MSSRPKRALIHQPHKTGSSLKVKTVHLRNFRRNLTTLSVQGGLEIIVVPYDFQVPLKRLETFKRHGPSRALH